MGFFHAVGRCYGNMLNFHGRARRAEYWWFFLFQVLMGIALQVALVAYVARDGDFIASLEDPAKLEMWFAQNPEIYNYAGYAFAGWLIFVLVPNLSVTIRRLHDTDRSGWMFLMPTAVGILSGLIGGVLMGATAASGNVGGTMFWAIAIMILPMLASLYLFILLCLPGTHGNNRFGPDSAPDRKRPPPAHPAFAPDAAPEQQAETAALRRAEAQDYYRRHVLPSVQKA